jgi:hypothetical protein
MSLILSKVNIPLNGGKTKQTHAVVEHNSSGIVQSHTGLLELILTADNSEVIVAGAEDVSHLEQVCQDGGGLKSLEGVLDNVGPLAEKSDKVCGVLLLEEAEVRSSELLVAKVDPSSDRAQTSVGVLEVRTGVTLERGHDIHVKLVVVDSSLVSGDHLSV